MTLLVVHKVGIADTLNGLAVAAKGGVAYLLIGCTVVKVGGVTDSLARLAVTVKGCAADLCCGVTIAAVSRVTDLVVVAAVAAVHGVTNHLVGIDCVSC